MDGKLIYRDLEESISHSFFFSIHLDSVEITTLAKHVKVSVNELKWN